MLQAILNRVDYARLHGYTLYVEETLHPRVSGPWNKVAVLDRAFRLFPHASHFLFIDNDAAILNPHIPVETGKYGPEIDFVIKGKRDGLFVGVPDPIIPINSGVLLIRNTPWAARLVSEWLEIAIDFDAGHAKGMNPKHECNTSICLKVRDFFGERYLHYVYDQNGLVYLLHKLPELEQLKVALEPIHGEFNSADMHYERTFGRPKQRQNDTFSIGHFSGCQYCGPAAITFNRSACLATWEHAWKRSRELVRFEERRRMDVAVNKPWLDALPMITK